MCAGMLCVAGDDREQARESVTGRSSAQWLWLSLVSTPDIEPRIAYRAHSIYMST